MVWDATLSRFESLKVLSVVLFGGSVYTVTLNAAPTATLAVGSWISPDAVQREVTAITRLLAAVFRLRGLGSLDFLLDGDTVEVLELNPRPPASLALYPRVGELDAALTASAPRVQR